MNITAYDILEISVDASLEEVKRAYIRLAKQYHPDVCKEANALDRMKNINLAYEAIRDGRGRWWLPSIPQTIPDPPTVQTLAEMIEWANTHVVEDGYLIRMFVGGHDAYSKIALQGLEICAGAGIAMKVRSAVMDDKVRSIALRWYLRGLQIDLAIRKACADYEIYRKRNRNTSSYSC